MSDHYHAVIVCSADSGYGEPSRIGIEAKLVELICRIRDGALTEVEKEELTTAVFKVTEMPEIEPDDPVGVRLQCGPFVLLVERCNGDA